MPRLIPAILGAVIRFFTGGKRRAPALQETASSGISGPASSLGPGDAPALQEKGLDLSRWQVTECRESPFLKAGRLFVANGTLVIRSDLDGRGVFHHAGRRCRPPGRRAGPGHLPGYRNTGRNSGALGIREGGQHPGRPGPLHGATCTGPRCDPGKGEESGGVCGEESSPFSFSSHSTSGENRAIDKNRIYLSNGKMYRDFARHPCVPCPGKRHHHPASEKKKLPDCHERIYLLTRTPTSGREIPEQGWNEGCTRNKLRCGAAGREEWNGSGQDKGSPCR